MNIAFLIISCLSLVFALSFLMAAVFTFATCVQKPLDRDVERALSLSLWLGSGAFIYVFAVTRYWRYSQLGRRFFYIGFVSGVVAIVFGLLATHGA